MKYIRTKNEIIEVNPTLTNEQIDIALGKNTPRADNIEELCDEFVRITGNNRHDTVDLELAKQYKIAYPNIKVFGAIWTDKGLIYVAKMNDKGELELL